MPRRPGGELSRRMLQDLQLAGLSPLTQQAYLRIVRQLAKHYQTAPDQLSEAQLRDYLLFLKNDKQFAASTLRLAYSGIKFFYTRTEPRDWQFLKNLRIPKQKQLPDVLSIDEVRRLIEAVRRPHYRAYLWTLYSLGLRRQEGLRLQVGDIDKERMLVHVRCGKGAKDRYVPLPAKTLAVLREHWATHRNRDWLFPGHAHNRAQAAVATRPVTKSSVHIAFQQAVQELRFRKSIHLHTLRHSYATHLLEAGVNIRLIQQYLGHGSLQSTMVYLHLTSHGQDQARAAIERLMA
jgi:site-specific recombinase XerD